VKTLIVKINEYGVNALKDAVNRAVMQFMASIDAHDVKIWRPGDLPTILIRACDSG
jgi:hypothetical protein